VFCRAPAPAWRAHRWAQTSPPPPAWSHTENSVRELKNLPNRHTRAKTTFRTSFYHRHKPSLVWIMDGEMRLPYPNKIQTKINLRNKTVEFGNSTHT
jgi:hypothetical protein